MRVDLGLMTFLVEERQLLLHVSREMESLAVVAGRRVTHGMESIVHCRGRCRQL